MRLKSKILVILVPILALQAVAFYLPASWVYERYFKIQVNHHISDYVSQLASAFRYHVEHLRADSSLISNSHFLKRYLSIEDMALRSQVMHHTLLSEFNSIQESNPNYFDISLVLPDGYEEVRQVNTGAVDLTESEQDSFYIKAFVESTDDFSIVSGINPDDERWALISGHRLYVNPNMDHATRKRHFAGWLIMKTDVGFLKDLIRESKLSQQGHLILYHDDGRIVWQSESNSALSSQHLNHIQQNLINDPSVHQLHNKKPGPPDLVAMKEGSLISTTLQLSAGLNMAVAWPESLLSSIMHEMGLASMTLSLVVMIASVFVLFIALNSILIKPIFNLSETAKRMGEGQLELSAPPSKDELGSLLQTVKTMGERLLRQKHSLHNIAFQDSLTKLPNRRRFLDQLEYHFDTDHQQKANSALLFIDLDGFKQVNDRFGHFAGDTVLKEVAARLKNALRTDDVVAESINNEDNFDHQVARLGGDEFTVLLRQLSSTDGIDAVARRILSCIRAPFLFEGQELFLSASIGIARGDSENQNASDMLKNADAAMYHAKQKGKNTYHYFDLAIAQQLYEKLKIKDKLHKAIANSEFSLAYQPQACSQTGSLVGVEALLRWHTPELGWIQPCVFIPIAEDAGLISQLGRWIMQEACHQNKKWLAQGLPVVPVSVNVSNLQFAQEDMAKTVAECLKQTELPAHLLKLEITESSIMQGPESIVQLKHIRENGVKVSLDDFGTGFSSLSALRGLPIDQLKIDKSFVSDLNNGSDAKAIVSAIIAMASQLQLEIVAEGVETAYELDFVKQKGVNIIQGYYFSQPLNAESFEKSWLQSTNGLYPQSDEDRIHTLDINVTG